MPPETPTPHDLVRAIVDREPLRDDASYPAAAAVHAASDRMWRELCRWVGTTGCQALFARALFDTRRQHPALAGIQPSADTEARLDGVAEAIDTAGPGPTVAALEAMLVALIELLGRFIGNDMVAYMVEQIVADRDAGGSHAGSRETTP